MTENYGEPWRDDPELGICDKDGEEIVDEGLGRPFADGVPQRFIACVNACAGIPTEALNEGVLRKFVWDVLRWRGRAMMDVSRPGGKRRPDGMDDAINEGAAILEKHGASWEAFT